MDAVLASMRQAVKKRKEADAGNQAGRQQNGRGMDQRRKESAIIDVQNLLREWWEQGVDPRQSVADWAIHVLSGTQQGSRFLGWKGM